MGVATLVRRSPVGSVHLLQHVVEIVGNVYLKRVIVHPHAPCRAERAPLELASPLVDEHASGGIHVPNEEVRVG